uniref:ribonuclease H n=1 Tax=Caenorhabditis brenneri TaxID=135651 RepID=B6VBC9_CAEBE|nr:hypothetical protein Cbre_JD04.007 [Caenorhabditis brenneri]
MGKNNQFYAVARGREVGIYRSWNECKKQVDGFQNPRFKKFDTEAAARKFVAKNMSVGGEKPAEASTSANTSAANVFHASRKRKHRGSAERDSQPKKVKEDVEEKEDPEFADAPVVFTDGACSSNGGKKAKAGWGVFWGDDNEDNEYGPVYGAATNNRGEYIAVEKALEKVNISKQNFVFY